MIDKMVALEQGLQCIDHHYLLAKPFLIQHYYKIKYTHSTKHKKALISLLYFLPAGAVSNAKWYKFVAFNHQSNVISSFY